MLRVDGLHKAYGDTVALRGVDLHIEAGEICGLLGPNGAGKTSLVSIVTGLRRPDAGTVEVCGVDAVAHPEQARRFLGLAPQDLGLYPSLTVKQNLVFFGELCDLRGRRLAERIEEVATALELVDFLDRRAGTLSGGEKRRVHTAMALLHRPPLLLLDEPTTGVDVATRSRLLEVVRGLAAAGTAVCYSTHYLAEVEQLGATVAILDGGEIIARGPVSRLVSAHGGSAVELCFDGPGEVPRLSLPERMERLDDRIRIFTDRPAEVAAQALGALGAGAARLRGIEIVAPSLESVFLALTGRRFEAESGERSDVVAP